MSAPASAEQPTALSIGELAEEQVRRTVKALRSAHDVSIKVMCERIGISRGTYFSRMNGSTPFTAGEVAELAALFGVHVGDIYSGRITLGPTPPTPISFGQDGDESSTRRNSARDGGAVLIRPQFGASRAAVVASATTSVRERISA